MQQSQPLLVLILQPLLLSIKDFLTWKMKSRHSNIDHSLALLATIKSEFPTAVKEYIGESLDDALYKVVQRHTVDLIKEHSVLHMALYHALKKSILEDEDTMDKGVVDKSKKRKPDDTDRDEGPPA
ncbi:hypothetical protein Tco_1256085 [Tanacetum coccineum]